MLYWILMFRDVRGGVELARTGPLSYDELDEAAEIALSDGYVGVYVFDREPDLGEAALRVADDRPLARMDGIVRAYVEDTEEEELPFRLAIG